MAIRLHEYMHAFARTHNYVCRQMHANPSGALKSDCTYSTTKAKPERIMNDMNY